MVTRALKNTFGELKKSEIITTLKCSGRNGNDYVPKDDRSDNKNDDMLDICFTIWDFSGIHIG